MEMESMSSSSTATNTTAPLNQQVTTDDTLWKHVTKVAKSERRGGNTKIKCNFCNNEFVGSLSRGRAHLLKIKGHEVAVCTKISPEIVRQIQRELAEAEEMKRAIDIPLPPSGQNQSTSAWGGVEKMQMQGTKRRAVDINNPINKAYNMEVRSQIDSEIARAFYSDF
ncbi:hypothetical protein OROGR_009544 [Orobanche gracilis]